MAYYPEIETLADVVRFHARERPNSPAMVFEGKTTTYAQWAERCMKVANGLIVEGVKPGSRIAVLDNNTAAYFEILFGAAASGAVTVALNWRLAAAELAYILNDAAAEVLFVCEDHAQLAERALEDVSSVRRVVILTGERRNWVNYDAWRESRSATDPAVPLDREAPVVQMYTSGTTGHPKGVELSSRSFYVRDQELSTKPEQLLHWMDWGPDDVSLVTMPVFHISGTGWGIAGLYNGAKNVILNQFEPEAVLDAIHHHGISKLVLVPAAIQMMLMHPKCKETDFSSIGCLLYGASPIPLALLSQAMAAFQCEFVQVYGLTEVCGAVTYLPAEDHVVEGNKRMRSAGRAFPGVRIEIRDGEGRTLANGEVGEICIHSPTLMNGYWNRPEATAECIDAQGWFRSGDAGYMDDDGYVYIHDRVKDMIVSGGENVYPAEVENAIFGHEDVAEVAVISVPDAKWGEAVKAVVVPKAGKRPTQESIIAWARARIAGYKLPKSVDFVEILPRNASGKVLKRELREPYWKGMERRVN